MKNIVGATYETRQFDDKFKFSTFYKHYFQNARLIDPEKVDGVYVPVEHKAEISASGYGGTISYKFLKTLTIMFSGEKALRLPDETELLGNTTENVDASYDLKPEESLNLNLGAILGPYSISQHHFGFNANIYMRDIKNMISRKVSNSLTAETYAYENLGKVLSRGVDMEANYSYNNMINITANLSMFNARFNLKHDEYGVEYVYYGDRLRNAPYFTSNITAEFTKNNIIQKGSRFTAYYNFGYVHEFFRNWESLGGNGKIIIQSQYVHDIGVSYLFPKHKITLSVDVKNIFNEQIFDNWALQKAGRAFYGKIGYRIF